MSTPIATIIFFPLVLGILIFVHELGHFTAAKLSGIRVLEFALGFPPRLISRRRGETDYSINVLPLGGYVRMLGENGEERDDPASFGAKPWWKRGCVLLAGPTMNIGLALALYFIAAAWLGSPVGTTTVDSVSPGSPALAAGIMRGDQILKVDGRNVHSLVAVHNLTDRHLGHTVTITIVRNGREMQVKLVPRRNPPSGQGAVGVVMRIQEKRYPVGIAVAKSFQGFGTMVMAVPNVIASIGTHGPQNVSGPIGIARITGQSAADIPQIGIGQFFAFVALLSANLGVFNLLPLPALDGGRIILVLFAAVRRRNVDPRVEGMIHLVGMAILLGLMVFISYNDIVHWVSGQ